MGIDAIGTAPTGSAAMTAGAGLADNFETFLLLLTKQLQHQDPLSPLDTAEFTSQLAMFTGVEQAIATNRNLELLLGLLQSNLWASAVNYLGKTVGAPGDLALLTEGHAEWSYTLAANAASTAITIFNEAGETVFSGAGETAAGEHGFVWDGLDNTGALQPDGAYRIEISADDADGNAIAMTIWMSGEVTAMEMVDGLPMLVVGSMLLPLSEVTTVKKSAPAEL